MVWNGMAWYGDGLGWREMVWRGVKWNGMGWRRMVWDGMAWNGVDWLDIMCLIPTIWTE